MAHKHKPMNRTEIELCAITGTWKGMPLREVNYMKIITKQEISDFLMVVHLHNAEVLDEMWDTSVGKMMLESIGIKCGE